MAKILKTLRNNWKKTVFFTGLSAYAYDFGSTEYKKNLLMRDYCKEAVKLGDATIQTLQSPRHVVVILNPASNKKKAMKEFQRYCAPLLHLSGASVTLLTTDDKNDALNLVKKVPENTDALIIAGGDGTISDVVTGLLRRYKSDQAQKLLPIGILPLGKTNSLAKQLYSSVDEIKNDKLNRLVIMLKATYSVIHEVTKNIDAMEIENISSDDKKLLPVYAVHRLRIGSFRNADAKVDRYWYFGKLRSYASYLLGSHNRDPPVKVMLQYTPPCSGCSTCYKERLDLRQIKVEKPKTRWWHVFVRTSPPAESQDTDYSKVKNPSCGTLTETHLNTIDLRLGPKIIDQKSAIEINIGPEQLSYFDFVREGWKRLRNYIDVNNEDQKIYAQTVFVHPQSEDTEVESWASIDNEEYELKTLRIELLHNVLPVFVLPQ